MRYKVRLDIFEGPFDLLVYLIENAKMSIYDIKLSQITGQYIEYMEDMRGLDVALSGEFIALAATLIEIKSRMLLPWTETSDDGGVPGDPRKELVIRLLEYKRYKQAARFLEEREEVSRCIFTKPKDDISIYTKEPDVYLCLDSNRFVKAFNLFLHNQKKVSEVKQQYAGDRHKRMSIEERILQVKEILRKAGRLRFRELISDKRDRHSVILTFLSLLELARQKRIKLKQNVNFGEIILIAGEPDSSSQRGA